MILCWEIFIVLSGISKNLKRLGHEVSKFFLNKCSLNHGILDSTAACVALGGKGSEVNIKVKFDLNF